MLLEACCGSVEEVVAASRAGADRVELCAGLPTGGVTPTPGMVEEAKSRSPIPLVAMIRPREGRACPPEEDQAAALRDVRHLVRAGADQLIFGWLTPENRIDAEGMKRMIEAADGVPCCFHRVFDMARDLDEALDDLMELGFIRVLTSGGAETVDEAFPVLERLQVRAGDSFTILAGGGVRESNCQELARRGLREIHFSFRQPTGHPGYGGVADFQPLPERISAIRRLTSG